MTELTLEQKRKVVGGAGIPAAFLNAIGGIVKSGLGFIENMYTDIATTVFLFKHANDYDKLEVKMGNSTIKYDNTQSNKLELENQAKLPEPVFLV
ncbi:hypothetical protein SCHIN_v1c03850 [Spiroplasma chinense]|uniref:Uncharacterized protein n=1 Tax=Spiroplasma chinense TaxID=216932 RepID=A0A5B9Y699_9MOLU|nr:hypothetical protein [Spiroplasma chinense]QEH61582.1 hypothetical protein SCHIN_v1c03850 [Spiroplasma chinense]